MEKANKKQERLSYDDAIQKAETLVSELEQTPALSVSDYQKKAAEVKRLLDVWENELKGMNYSAEQ